MKDIYTRKTIPIDAGDVFVLDYRGHLNDDEVIDIEQAARFLYERCLKMPHAHVALIQLGPHQNTVGLG